MASTPSRAVAPASAHGLSLRARLLGGGTDGNELLTSATAVLLLVLLAVEGVTIILLRPLISMHIFVGLLLIPPVALKLGSTGYRFVRYYANTVAYRLKGPPPLFMRATAPVLVVSTVVVFATGVGLLLLGTSSRDWLLQIHKVSFIVWGVFFGLHVLGHLTSLPRAVRADYSPGTPAAAVREGLQGRRLALALSLVLGVAIAVLAVIAVPDFTAWLHYRHHHH